MSAKRSMNVLTRSHAFDPLDTGPDSNASVLIDLEASFRNAFSAAERVGPI
jgi:hypothetical protein